MFVSGPSTVRDFTKCGFVKVMNSVVGRLPVVTITGRQVSGPTRLVSSASNSLDGSRCVGVGALARGGTGRTDPLGRTDRTNK